jgi:hypothetical protein
MGIAPLERLPGIRWELHNLAQLQKVNPKKFAELADELAARLAATASAPVAPTASVAGCPWMSCMNIEFRVAT